MRSQATGIRIPTVVPAPAATAADVPRVGRALLAGRSLGARGGDPVLVARQEEEKYAGTYVADPAAFARLRIWTCYKTRECPGNPDFTFPTERSGRVGEDSLALHGCFTWLFHTVLNYRAVSRGRLTRC